MMVKKAKIKEYLKESGKEGSNRASQAYDRTV